MPELYPSCCWKRCSGDTAGYCRCQSSGLLGCRGGDDGIAVYNQNCWTKNLNEPWENFMQGERMILLNYFQLKQINKIYQCIHFVCEVKKWSCQNYLSESNRHIFMYARTIFILRIVKTHFAFCTNTHYILSNTWKMHENFHMGCHFITKLTLIFCISSEPLTSSNVENTDIYGVAIST